MGGMRHLTSAPEVDMSLPCNPQPDVNAHLLPRRPIRRMPTFQIPGTRSNYPELVTTNAVFGP